jgi:diguanylate cyclase (GGDEF)-like protein
LTTQRDLEREILHLSVTDHLTGILNRERFMDLLAEEMERSVRYGHPLSIIMFDIDFFKTINETYGHEAGDRVLKGIVDLTRTCLRRTDSLSRWGGEEFIILSVETDLRGAMKLAERIRELVAATEIFPDRRITVSCGVVQYNAGSDTPDGLVKYADDSLYAAKGNGRNRVEAIRR